MARYRFKLRDLNGNPVTEIHPEDWLFFEYTRKLNDVASAQGILSTKRSPELQNAFNIRENGRLDYVLEVHRGPNRKPDDGDRVRVYRLDAEFLLRYDRKEHLNDGRPRETIILRDIKHLLTREKIQPLTATPPVNYQLSDFYPPSPTAWPWPLPTEDAFAGNPAGDTATQMAEMVARAKTTNPAAFAAILIPPPPAGGISPHAISERYKTLLDALQRASSASWYDWFQQTGGVGTPNACDFDLVNTAPSQWIFRVYPNGRGADKRIGTPNAVLISPRLDNVIQPVTLTDRLDEITRILVGGRQKGLGRDIILMANQTAELDSAWNSITSYHDSRNIDDFGARARPSSCSTLGATQLRLIVDDFVCSASTVRVTFKNDIILTATVLSFVPATGQLDLDFGIPIDCDTHGGAETVTCLDPNSDVGIEQSFLQGSNRLREKGERRSMSMILRQTEGVEYGVDIDLGDLVTISFDGDRDDRQVRKIRVVLSHGRTNEQVDVEFGMIDGRYWHGASAFEQIIENMRDVKKEGDNAGVE